MIKKIILMIISPALSIYLTSLIMDSINIGSLEGLLVVSIFLGVLNMTLKPILKFLALPATILTLGLFSFVINGLMVFIAFELAPGVSIDGLWSSILASFLISIFNMFLENILD